MATKTCRSTEEGLDIRRARMAGKHADEKSISSEYIERERDWLNEAVKSVERSRVADFITANKPVRKIRLLSLPSIHWSFERELVGRYEECRFFGVERTWGVIELGRAYMPGGRSMEHVVNLDIGEIKALCSRGDDPNVFSHHLWVNVGDFLSLTLKEIGKNRSRRFRHVYRRMNAAWLDFTSMICAEVRRSLMKLGAWLDSEDPCVPIVVTFMGARDNHSSDDGRIREVSKLLGSGPHRDFILSDSWKYIHHDIPMLTVCGLMLPKRQERPATVSAGTGKALLAQL